MSSVSSSTSTSTDNEFPMAMTWEEELASLVIQISTGWRKGCMKRVGPWTRIFVLRYATPMGANRSLEEVGLQSKLTRQRVQQVCDVLMTDARKHRLDVPVTRELLAQAAKLAPAGEEEVNNQLRARLGCGAGIAAVVSFANELGLFEVPVRMETSKLRMSGQMTDIRMLIRSEQPAWIETDITIARDDTSSMGCSTLMRVAGQMALEHGRIAQKDALISVLALVPGFRWLETEGGWFTVGDGGSSSNAACRVRKLLTVAQEPVNVDEIAEALITDDLWLSRERERAAGLPPLHVLRELLLGWDWLDCIQHNRFSLSSSDEFPGDSVLSDSERLTVQVIESNDGVACRHQIVDHLREALDVTPVGVNAMLGSSPILRKIEHGLYGLRGRRMGNQALAHARARLASGSPAGRLEVTAMTSGADEPDFALRITEASLRNEQYGLPSRMRDKLPPGDIQVVLPDGRRDVARLGPGGVLRQVNRLFTDLQPGHVIGCRWDMEALHFSEPMGQGQPRLPAVN